jgi:hypothetical protein
MQYALDRKKARHKKATRDQNIHCAGRNVRQQRGKPTSSDSLDAPSLSQFECSDSDLSDESVTGAPLKDDLGGPLPDEGVLDPLDVGDVDSEDEVEAFADVELDPQASGIPSTFSGPSASNPKGKRVWEEDATVAEEPSDKRSRVVEEPCPPPAAVSDRAGEDSPSREFVCDL